MADNEAFQKVANTGDIPEGESRFFPLGEHGVVICKQDGQFFAVENMCSHARSPLQEGPLAKEFQILCPMHGARFDVRNGKAMCLPAVMPIKTYALEERGDEIWLAIK